MGSKQLAEQIIKYRKLYSEGKPVVSDEEYDALESQLKEFEPDHPLLQEVGTPIKQSTFAKVKHGTRMLSLDKCYADTELTSWVKRTGQNHERITMPKMDGLAVELLYKKEGINSCTTYLQGVSRGDGEYGDDITENVRQCSGVPKILVEMPEMPKEFGVRGEIVLLKQDFIALGLEDQGFKNCRNTVAGTIRNKNPDVVAQRKLVFMPYGIVVYSGDQPETHSQVLSLLKAHGFNTVPYKVEQDSDLVSSWRNIESVRDKFPYDIDGMVVAVNNLKIQGDQGVTGHHPKGLIACKFASESAETILIDIQWQVSRTGLINPVGIFDAVDLDGASIGKATLHNLSEIKRLGLKVEGTRVIVARQGGCIPKIVKKVSTPEDTHLNTFTIPDKCPDCASPTETHTSADGVETLHCPNMECPAAVMSRILHYVSCMDIEGLGEGVLSRMMDAGLVKSIVDLYHVEPPDLMRLDKIGRTLANKIVNSIWDASQFVVPYKYLWALGVPGVGRSMSERICEMFKIEELLHINTESIKKIEGIDDKSANAIVSFLSSNEVHKFYTQTCISTGTVPCPVTFSAEEKEQESVSKLLAGVSFVVSGTLSISRKEIEKEIKSLGGTIKSSVSKKLNYLLAGDNAGSKLQKAQVFGVKVISEADYRYMVSDTKPEDTESAAKELEQLEMDFDEKDSNVSGTKTDCIQTKTSNTVVKSKDGKKDVELNSSAWADDEW